MSARVNHELATEAAEAILQRALELVPQSSIPTLLTLAQTVATIMDATNTNPPSEGRARAVR